MPELSPPDRSVYLRRGITLERITLGWNIIGIGVLAFAAIRAQSIALAGFGLDSLVARENVLPK